MPAQFVDRITINPLTGLLDLTSIPNPRVPPLAEEISFEYDCEPTALIGDLVYLSRTVPDKVEVISVNVYDDLELGTINTKLTPTRCRVLIIGKLRGSEYQLSGLQPGKTVFVGTDGQATTTAPVSGHRQAIGVATHSDGMILYPSGIKTVLN